MTMYALPDGLNESWISKVLKARGWLVLALVPFFLIAFYLGVNSTGRTAGLYRVLGISSLVVLVNLWNPFRRRNVYQEIATALRVNTIEIDSDGLRINWSTWTKLIPWEEVAEVEESTNGRGLYVRTRNRFTWYVIPRRTERYEEIKVEFAGMGVPIVQKSAPSNWGFLFVFLFCSSVLCNIPTQDRRILAINFAVALILGGVGAMQALSIGDRRLRLRSMLGAFLPAAFSTVSLIFPFGIK